jgi:fermentation-respiration switch protein FrsA (DUF1100 family)
VRKPLLVIVGEQDELFQVDQFEPLVEAHSDGQVLMISDANHNSVHYHPQAVAAIGEWLNGQLQVEYAEQR